MLFNCHQKLNAWTCQRWRPGKRHLFSEASAGKGSFAELPDDLLSPAWRPGQEGHQPQSLTSLAHLLYRSGGTGAQLAQG